MFARFDKKTFWIMPAGEAVLEKAGEILRHIETIEQSAKDYSNEKESSLSTAATHSLARYVLPAYAEHSASRFAAVGYA